MLHTHTHTHTYIYIYIYIFYFIFQHKFEQKCGDVNNYSVVQNNPSVFNYCTAEDVPDNIHFGVRSSGIDGGILTGIPF